MTVRAKMYVTEVAKTTNGDRVKLQAVCRGEDNKVWSKFTPNANFEMHCLNPEATAQFEVGKEYFVDFTPAPTGQEGME
jgi:hypothetical protein